VIILAGIKLERENPRKVEGKQALFALNLPEKKMAGEISQGMLFDVGYADKITPYLAVPEGSVPNVQEQDNARIIPAFLDSPLIDMHLNHMILLLPGSIHLMFRS